MKRILFIAFNLLYLLGFSQEKQNVLKHFDTSSMKTAVLYQESPLFNLQDFQNNTNDIYGFYQAYKGMQQGDLKKRIPVLNILKKKEKQSYIDKIIPLSLLVADYETIKEEALTSGSVYHDEMGFLYNLNTSNRIYKQHSIFVTSPLRAKHKGLKVTFVLKDEDIFNLTKLSILSVKIDFNDGLGLREIATNKVIPIHYSSAGVKELEFEMQLNDGSIKRNKASINIQYSNRDLKTLFDRDVYTFESSIIPDLAVYGEEVSYTGKGEYQIFLSTGEESVLNKPLFIIDGFDPQDGRPIEGYTDEESGDYVRGIYDLLDFENESGETVNLGDMIREEGFDIVILNFPEYLREADEAIIDGGTDFVERNAMLLVELIGIINAEKVGDEQNVIIGPSMGGLISRYALNYMENQGLDYDTRLWMSFDSPHLGANVPIGFQHQFNFLAYGLDDFWFIGNQNVEALHPLVDGFIKSSAARQMLVDHMDSHITSDDGVSFDPALVLPQAHPFKEIFYNRLNALTASGFPENLRRISLINGSGVGAAYYDLDGEDILPGRKVIDTVIDVEDGVEAYLEVSYTPYADEQIEVSEVYIDFAWWVPAFDVESEANSKAPMFSNGVDASAGGLYDLGQVAEAVGTSGLAGEFLDALQTDYFCFIPSNSGMAISFPEGEIDWFQTPTESNPFDAWYMPEENEKHVTFSQDNVNFAWDEIVLAPYVSTSEDTLSHIQIAKNPVNTTLELICDTSVGEFQLSIYDTTGKQVFNANSIQASARTAIPIALNSGIYFVNIQIEQRQEVLKLIVE